jgi:Protein of unknown function (DUF1173)
MHAPRTTDDVDHEAEPACWVRLAGRVLPLSALRAAPDQFAPLFVRARAEFGYAECLCRSKRPARLVIRCRSGRHHLAVWPEQGHLHRAHCPWFRPDPALSGRGVYTHSAILTTDNGTALRLATSLITHSEPSSPPRPASPDETDATASRRSLSLLAVVHFLWEQAGLSVWSRREGRRTWRTCHARLLSVIQDCTANGTSLGDLLYVVPTFDRTVAQRNAQAWEDFTASLGQQRASRCRGLVLGEIRRIMPTEYGVCLRLAHQRAPIYASMTLMEKVRRSHRSALADHNDHGRRVALLVVDRSRNGYTIAVDMAVALVSAAYLPVDSGHELRMADALVAAGRSILKPLHYDRDDAVMPDFVLLDTAPATYIEVWGVTGRQDYEQRKQIKQAHYRSAGRSLLEWDVRQPMPDVTRR